MEYYQEVDQQHIQFCGIVNGNTFPKKRVKYLFTEVGANRIEAGFDSNNPNSGRVMEKAGMIREGLVRQGGRNNQGLFDLVLYGILKEDFLGK